MKKIMKMYLFTTFEYITLIIICISLFFYFRLANNQDLTLFIFGLFAFLYLLIKKIHYKKTLVTSGLVMGISIIAKISSKPIQASETISLSYILFILGIFQIFYYKISLLYLNEFLHYTRANDKK